MKFNNKYSTGAALKIFLYVSYMQEGKRGGPVKVSAIVRIELKELAGVSKLKSLYGLHPTKEFV